MSQTTFRNPIYVGDQPTVDCHYGPWNSVSEYLAFVTGELLLDAPVKGTTIGVLSGSTIKEYWNPSDADTFIEKAQGGGGGTSVNVVDNLTSTSTTDALSANQGRVLKSQVDTKMSASQQFKTVGGQSIFGTGNIPVGSGDFPEYASVVVDLQPSAIGGDDNTLTAKKYNVDIPAGTELHIGAAASTLIQGTTLDTSRFSKIRMWAKIEYEDGTIDSTLYWDDNINSQTGQPTGLMNFEETTFIPTKRVTKIWGVAQANRTPNVQNPRLWVYHYQNTIEKPSPWNGKYIFVCGDSISVDIKHMNELNLAEDTSVYMVGDDLGAIVINCSVGGFTVKQQFPVPDQLSQIYAVAEAASRTVVKPDAIIIELGSNNHAYGCAISQSSTGESTTPVLNDVTYNTYKSDVFTVWTDETETTLANCPRKYLKENRNLSVTAEFQMLHDMFRHIFPAIPIFYISTLKRIWRSSSSGTNNAELDALNGKNLTLEAYSKAIERVAFYYGSQYVDVQKCISPKTEMERALWYTPADDGVHPNGNAHRYRIYPIILEVFKQLRPYAGVIPSTDAE